MDVITSPAISDRHIDPVQLSPASLREHLRRMPPPNRDGVCVLMNAYNAMPYLPEAIDSILKQTFSDFDFVIVNDGSTDGTPDYLDSLSDSRIEVIHQTNRGTSTAANVGMTRCRRKWIARMDADDRCDATRLQQQVDLMRDQPDLAMVGSNFRYFGDRRRGSPIALPSDHDAIVAKLMRGHHGIVHGSIMLDAETVFRAGGYWEHGFFEDWDLFLRMAAAGRVANLPDPLYEYRALPTSISGRRMAEMRDRYRHAIENAERTGRGQDALSWAEFEQQLLTMPRIQRWANSADSLALAQYRRALGEMYSGRPAAGWMRLFASALLNPVRTIRRVCPTVTS